VSGAAAGGAAADGRGSGDPPATPPAPIVPLAALVRGEALRSGMGERIRPDPARLAAGWERRFVIELARAADLSRLYEESGFEVALDPVPPESLEDGCTDCRLVARLEYVMLYTRRAGSR
jgi:hypothetical protein